MNIKLLNKHNFEFQSLKGGCTGSPESTLVKMPHCWKSHVVAQLWASSWEKQSSGFTTAILKPTCSATENSQNIEILNEASFTISEFNKGTDQTAQMHKLDCKFVICTQQVRFSRDKAHITSFENHVEPDQLASKENR